MSQDVVTRAAGAPGFEPADALDIAGRFPACGQPLLRGADRLDIRAIEFDYARFDKLKAALGSENKAFKAMHINRSSGQRALKRREQATAPPVAVEVLAEQPRLSYRDDVPMGLDDLKGDLIEMVTWWRERKLRQVQPRRQRSMVRWTIHVDPAWVNRVKELSDAQRMSQADVVDDIFRAYFERTV
jgi:hypothetical protein